MVGDGTVPAESARAHGLRATVTAEVQGVAHRDLVGDQAVWDQVLTWLAAPHAAGAASAAAQHDVARAGHEQQAAAAPATASSRQPGGTAAVRAGQRQQDRKEEEEEELTFWNPLAWRPALA